MTNVIDESGILAISTRLQRLTVISCGKTGYRSIKPTGSDAVSPSGSPLFYTLHLKPVLSVVEIAVEIGYSHPSTISLLKELEKQKADPLKKR